ncbi:hypothetical protein [Paenibacillus xylanexedens]
MKFSKKATLGLLFSLTLIVAGCGQKSASDANTSSTGAGNTVPVD